MSSTFMKQFKQKINKNKNKEIKDINKWVYTLDSNVSNKKYEAEVNTTKKYINEKDLVDNLDDLMECNIEKNKEIDLSEVCDSFFRITYRGSKLINGINKELFSVVC